MKWGSTRFLFQYSGKFIKQVKSANKIAPKEYEKAAEAEAEHEKNRLDFEVRENVETLQTQETETKPNLERLELETQISRLHRQQREAKEAQDNTLDDVYQMANEATSILSGKVRRYAKTVGVNLESDTDVWDWVITNDSDPKLAENLRTWLHEIQNGPGILKKGFDTLSSLGNSGKELDRNLINGRDIVPLMALSYAIYAGGFRAVHERKDTFWFNSVWAVRLGVLLPVVTGLSNKLISGEESPVISTVKAAGKGYFELLRAGFTGSKFMITEVLKADNPSEAWENIKKKGKDAQEWLTGGKTGMENKMDAMNDRLETYANLDLGDYTFTEEGEQQSVEMNRIFDAMVAKKYDAISNKDIEGLYKFLRTADANMESLMNIPKSNGGITAMPAEIREIARKKQVIKELSEVVQFSLMHDQKLFVKYLRTQVHLQNWNNTGTEGELYSVLQSKNGLAVLEKAKRNGTIHKVDQYNGKTPQVMKRGELGYGMNGVEWLATGLMTISVGTKVAMGTVELLSGEMFGDSNEDVEEKEIARRKYDIVHQEDVTAKEKKQLNRAYNRIRKAKKRPNGEPYSSKNVSKLLEAAEDIQIINHETEEALAKVLIGKGAAKKEARKKYVDTLLEKGSDWDFLMSRTTRKDVGGQFLTFFEKSEADTENKIFENATNNHKERMSILDTFSSFRQNLMTGTPVREKPLTYQTSDGVKTLAVANISESFHTSRSLFSFVGEVTGLQKIHEKVIKPFYNSSGVFFKGTTKEGDDVSVAMWVKDGTPQMRVFPNGFGIGGFINEFTPGSGHKIVGID